MKRLVLPVLVVMFVAIACSFTPSTAAADDMADGIIKDISGSGPTQHQALQDARAAADYYVQRYYPGYRWSLADKPYYYQEGLFLWHCYLKISIYK